VKSVGVIDSISYCISTLCTLPRQPNKHKTQLDAITK